MRVCARLCVCIYVHTHVHMCVYIGAHTGHGQCCKEDSHGKGG